MSKTTRKTSRTPRKQTREMKCEARFSPAAPLKPKNAFQVQYLNAIEDSPITVATGYPGTGKTYLPARVAASWYRQGRIDSIILSRPPMSGSQSLGYFKGTVEEKMQAWLAPVLGALQEEFSRGELDYLIKDPINRISFVPLETIKGSSWKNAFVIIDEAEDLTLKEIKSILTRIGANSRIVLSGDIGQTDLAYSGLSELLNLREADERFGRHISHVAFDDPAAIVRSDTCREIILGFERAGR